MELEDTGIELDRVKNDLSTMDKKQRKVDQMMSEWKQKCDLETRWAAIIKSLFA